MDFNWSQIRDRMLSMCKTAFGEDHSLSISEDEICEDITIFYNVCNAKMNYVYLDGFRSEFKTQLQDCFIERIDSVNSVKSFANSLDAFIKRVLILTGLKAYRDIQDKALMALVKTLNDELENRGSKLLGRPLPDFENTTDQSLLNNGNGQYLFKKAREVRNISTHNSPDLDMANVALGLRYCIAFYIYIVHCVKPHLLASTPEFANGIDNTESEKILSADEIRAFNFIAYGNRSRELKTRYIDCFVLLLLFQNGELPLNTLKDETQEFLGKIKTQISVNNSIKRLIKDGLLQETNGKLSLTEKGENLIVDNRDNLIANKNSFHDDLLPILEEYGVQSHSVEIEERLTIFIDDNALDIADKEGIYFRNEELENFLNLFEEYGLKDNKPRELFAKIIKLCKTNDILVKLSLGKAIGKMTDLDQFSSNIRNMPREIYLDSNVALYLICLNEDFPAGYFYDFKIGKAILDHAKENNNLCLKISSVYLKEVEFNLRRALLLTSWEGIGWNGKYLPTNNLFYRHYMSLCKDNVLPEGVNSFSDYLEYNFDLTPDDADLQNEDLQDVIVSIVRQKLKSLGIDIVDNHFIEPNYINRSKRIFQEAVKEVLSNKDELQLNNDVLMGEHLFADDSYNLIFLSNDKSFVPYRKKFIELYHRDNPDVWLLFSASRFVGHIDLLNSKFNTQMLTDELLALVETEDFKSKSIKLADVVGRLVDVAKLTGVQKKKRISMVVKMIYQDDNLDSFEISNEIEERTKKVNEIWDKVRNEIGGKMDIRKFYTMLIDPEFFESTISIIEKSLQDIKRNISDTCKEIEILINDGQSEKNIEK